MVLVIAVGEATLELLRTSEVQEWGSDLPPHTDLQKIVAMDTSDHYRTFAEFEKVFATPYKIDEDCSHQISSRQKKFLIERFHYIYVFAFNCKNLINSTLMLRITGLCFFDIDI